MKKIWMAAASLLLMAGSLEAQKNNDTATAIKSGGIHQRQKGKHTEKGMRNVSLTDAQKTAAKSLKENFQKQSAALKNDKNISAEELKTRTAALKKEQHEKMQSLLTADQQKQMAVNRQKQRDGQQNGNRDKFMKKLDLTTDQQSRLQESRTAMQSKMKAIKEDKSLTEVQKKEQVKNISRQQKENLKSILTPEQLEKMKAGRKGGKRGVKSENVK